MVYKPNKPKRIGLMSMSRAYTLKFEGEYKYKFKYSQLECTPNRDEKKIVTFNRVGQTQGPRYGPIRFTEKTNRNTVLIDLLKKKTLF